MHLNLFFLFFLFSSLTIEGLVFMAITEIKKTPIVIVNINLQPKSPWEAPRFPCLDTWASSLPIPPLHTILYPSPTTWTKPHNPQNTHSHNNPIKSLKNDNNNELTLGFSRAYPKGVSCKKTEEKKKMETFSNPRWPRRKFERPITCVDEERSLRGGEAKRHGGWGCTAIGVGEGMRRWGGA